jgi:hypothetical protein
VRRMLRLMGVLFRFHQVLLQFFFGFAAPA